MTAPGARRRGVGRGGAGGRRSGRQLGAQGRARHDAQRRCFGCRLGGAACGSTDRGSTDRVNRLWVTRRRAPASRGERGVPVPRAPCPPALPAPPVGPPSPCAARPACPGAPQRWGSPTRPSRRRGRRPAVGAAGGRVALVGAQASRGCAALLAPADQKPRPCGCAARPGTPPSLSTPKPKPFNPKT
jgi:hypothetical protein